MDGKHTGRCLCGAVTFEAEGPPLWVSHCHCQSCRRQTGSAMATFVGLASSRFEWVTGTPKTFASSAGVTRSFCDACGTPLAYESDGYPGEIHIYVSTFDQPDAFPPKAHVFVAERIAWTHMDDGLKKFDAASRQKKPAQQS